MQYLQYDPDTGEILCYLEFDGRDERTLALYPNVIQHPHVNRMEHYVLNGNVVPRPKMQVNLRCEPCRFVLSGLPSPCTVCVEGAEYEVGDGEFEFQTTFRGVFNLFVRAFPYIDWRGEARV